MLPLTSEDWTRVLAECGVDPEVARSRATSFARALTNNAFSAGLVRELPDFLTTIMHESEMLERLKERGNYSARRIRELAQAAAPGTRWRSLLNRADELAGKPEAFFEAVYAGRMGNGPEGSGDGARYPGRAYIGITGRDNYGWLGDAVGQDLLGLPHLAEGPEFALDFSIAWWEGKVPDRVLGDDRRVRKIVNGGYIGLAEAQRLSKLVHGVLAC